MSQEEARALRRLKRKTSIENLWIYMLSMLRVEELHVYRLIELIKERYGFDPGTVLPYVVIKKLESRGYVRGRRSGRRVNYELTEEGDRLLEEGISYLEGLVDKLKNTL